MAKFKVVENGYILGVGENTLPTGGISDDEYNMIATIIHNRPEAPEGYRYMLRADTLEWELVEIPPEPDDNPIEPEDAEAE